MDYLYGIKTLNLTDQIMKRKLLIATAVLAVFGCLIAKAQFGFGAPQQQTDANGDPKGPDLEYVVRLNVSLGQAFTVGDNGKGTRTVIPITGGTFKGKDIQGEILPGGADYQMQVDGRTEIEAIYCIRTDDGVNIHVRNCGIIKMGGQGGMYFRCAPKFEAPKDSKYAWMNESLFLCQPSFGGAGGGITLDVWRVK